MIFGTPLYVSIGAVLLTASAFGQTPSDSPIPPDTEIKKILADRIGLSSILTMVSYAIAVARQAPARTPARIRLPSYAVWETAVFVLNALQPIA